MTFEAASVSSISASTHIQSGQKSNGWTRNAPISPGGHAALAKLPSLSSTPRNASATSSASSCQGPTSGGVGQRISKIMRTSSPANGFALIDPRAFRRDPMAPTGVAVH
jgi:hypothetical protein